MWGILNVTMKTDGKGVQEWTLPGTKEKRGD